MTKPTLKHNLKIIRSIYDYTFEIFVWEIYPKIKDYRFLNFQDYKQNAFFHFNVSNKIELSHHYEAIIKDIKIGKLNSNQDLFQALCIEGYIEPGDYFIEKTED